MALARLAGCVAISASLHAAAMYGVAPLPAGLPVAGAATAPRVLQIRLASPPGPQEAIAPVEPASVPIKSGSSRRAQAPQAVSPSSGRLVEIVPPPHYYLARELDARPEPTHEIKLVFPENVPRGLTEGRLLLRLLINEDGGVDAVVVKSAEPRGVFEKSAIGAFRGARFSPGFKDGVAVKSQKLVEVNYRTEGPRAGAGARQ